MNMKQPPAYIITQNSYTQHPASYRNYCVSQKNSQHSQHCAAQLGWRVTTWPAVDGFTVDHSTWDRIGVKLLNRGAIIKRPGARGCFHSHFGLWQHCVNLGEPIIVLEHDARVQQPWDTGLDLTQCVWKLHRADGRGEEQNEITGHWSRGAWAYTLTPAQAGQLIDFSRSVGAQAVDKQIGANVVEWRYTNTDMVIHRPAQRISTTSLKLSL